MKKACLCLMSLLSISFLSSCSGEESVKEYNVYWLNDDGTLINKDVVKCGEHPVHDDPISKKTNKIGYHFEFVNWVSQRGELYSSSYVMPDEDIIFTSIFHEVINKYTVTWKDSDDSVIDTTTVDYNENPTHDDAVKPADTVKQEEYFFNGWYSGEEKINLAEYHITQDTSFNAKYDAFL